MFWISTSDRKSLSMSAMGSTSPSSDQGSSREMGFIQSPRWLEFLDCYLNFTFICLVSTPGPVSRWSICLTGVGLLITTSQTIFRDYEQWKYFYLRTWPKYQTMQSIWTGSKRLVRCKQDCWHWAGENANSGWKPAHLMRCKDILPGESEIDGTDAGLTTTTSCRIFETSAFLPIGVSLTDIKKA